MISPSLTITAPNGPPQPFSTDSIASRVASWRNCFLYSLLSMSCLLIGFVEGCVRGLGGRCFRGVGGLWECAAESASFSLVDARFILADFEICSEIRKIGKPTDA